MRLIEARELWTRTDCSLFCQIEDGILVFKLTGVQMCVLLFFFKQKTAYEITRDRKSTRLNSSHLVISYAVSLDRKSTRLNSSHLVISYAVFCLKKKKTPEP